MSSKTTLETSEEDETTLETSEEDETTLETSEEEETTLETSEEEETTLETSENINHLNNRFFNNSAPFSSADTKPIPEINTRFECSIYFSTSF